MIWVLTLHGPDQNILRTYEYGDKADDSWKIPGKAEDLMKTLQPGEYICIGCRGVEPR